MSEDIRIPRALLAEIESLLEDYARECGNWRDGYDSPTAYLYTEAQEKVKATLEEIGKLRP